MLARFLLVFHAARELRSEGAGLDERVTERDRHLLVEGGLGLPDDLVDFANPVELCRRGVPQRVLVRVAETNSLTRKAFAQGSALEELDAFEVSVLSIVVARKDAERAFVVSLADSPLIDPLLIDSSFIGLL